MGTAATTGDLLPAWVLGDLFPSADEDRLAALASAWAEQASQLASYGEQATAQLRTLEQTYTGEAADAARDRITQTASWLDSTGQACTALAKPVGQAAEYVRYTKQAMNVVLGALQTTSARALQGAAAQPNPVVMIKALVRVVQAQSEAHATLQQLHDACVEKVQGLSFPLHVHDPLPPPSAEARQAYGVTNASLGHARSGLNLPGDETPGDTDDTTDATGEPTDWGAGTPGLGGLAPGEGGASGEAGEGPTGDAAPDGEDTGGLGDEAPLDGDETATSLVTGGAGIAPAGGLDEGGEPTGADGAPEGDGLGAEPGGMASHVGDDGPPGQPSPGSGGQALTSDPGPGSGTRPTPLTERPDSSGGGTAPATGGGQPMSGEPSRPTTSQPLASQPAATEPSRSAGGSQPATGTAGGSPTTTSTAGSSGSATAGGASASPPPGAGASGDGSASSGGGTSSGGTSSGTTTGSTTTSSGSSAPPPISHGAVGAGLESGPPVPTGTGSLGGPTAPLPPATGAPPPSAPGPTGPVGGPAAPVGGPMGPVGGSMGPVGGPAGPVAGPAGPPVSGPAAPVAGAAPPSGAVPAAPAGTTSGPTGSVPPASHGTSGGPGSGPAPAAPSTGSTCAPTSRAEPSSTTSPSHGHETLVTGVVLATMLGTGIWQELGRATPRGSNGGPTWATSFGPDDEGPVWLPPSLATPFQKVLAPGEADRLLALRDTTVRGLVYPLDQVRGLDTPAALHEALGLGVALRDGLGGEHLAWSADAASVEVLRFAGLRTYDLIVPIDADVTPPEHSEIPWVVRPYARPWTGTGEAPGSTDDALIEEFEVLAEAAVAVPHLSEIWRLGADGSAEHVATYSARAGAWTATTARVDLSGHALPHGLQATVGERVYPAVAVSPTEHVIVRPAVHPDEAGPDGSVRTVVANSAITALTGQATVALWGGWRVRLLRIDGDEALVDYADADITGAAERGLRQLGQGQWETTWVPLAEITAQTRLAWTYPLPGDESSRTSSELVGIT